VDPNFAEAEKDTSAAHRASETQLRTEPGKQKDLVNLPLYCSVVGPGKNLVKKNLALSVQCRLDQKRRRVGLAIGSTDSRDRERRQTLQLRRLNQINGRSSASTRPIGIPTSMLCTTNMKTATAVSTPPVAGTASGSRIFCDTKSARTHNRFTSAHGERTCEV
jgi:hypothetical protein